MKSITWLMVIIKEKDVVRKIMRTLPTCFNPKVSFLKDRSDRDNLKKEELYGILTTYEMRTEHKNGYRKVVAFKAIGNPKSNRNECRNTIDHSDEEANFVRRL